ncbi:hypothetical protein CCYA_CCYA12G3345 [Cyanidiococcus yangmingshanensis]|nr:hypothetical protein CCYA_CCYA12G3345 [Cyanidiococcus yangmingshanensis]
MAWIRSLRERHASSDHFGRLKRTRRGHQPLQSPVAFIETIALPTWLFDTRLGKRLSLNVFRDDQFCLDEDGTGFSIRGNKARKLAFYARQTPKWLSQTRVVVSHGGVQSNAMLALAEFCNTLKVPFTYITRPVPRWLRKTPSGSLERALALGMRLCECDSAASYRARVSAMQQEAQQGRSDTLFVPQGVACPEAAHGLRQLAEAIASTNRCDLKTVCVPAGTGTTAWFLRQYLPPTIQVLTVPCVGDTAFLRAQMGALQALCQQRDHQIGTLLKPTVQVLPRKQGSFGTPRVEYYRLWRELPPYFDLVYAPVTIITLAEHFASEPERLSNVLYIATGGSEGNASQIRRYQREFGSTLPT